MAVPMDALYSIMDYVPTRDKAHAVSRVCRDWYDAAMASEWYVLGREVNPDILADENAEAWAWLARVNIVRLTLTEPPVLRAVLRAYPRLWAADADGGADAGNDGYRACPQQLFIRGTLTADDWSTVCGMRQLERLHCGPFAPAPGATLPALQHLNCDGVQTLEAWAALPEGMRSISMVHAADAALAQLARFKELESLALPNCDELTRVGFLHVARHVTSLTRLDLSDTGVDPYALSKMLRANPHLRALSLRNCEKLNDAELLSVGEERLRDAAAALPPPPATGVASDMRQMANLFTELKQKRKKTAATVPAVLGRQGGAVDDGTAPATPAASADSAATAQDADANIPADFREELAGCVAAGVGSILARSPLLEDVVLSGVGWLDDAGLRRIFAALRRLRVLRIAKNRHLTDDAFTADGVALPATLRTLSLSHCVQLGDATLGAIGRGLPHLEQLNLSSCPLMTSRGVLRVFEGCTKIRCFVGFVVGGACGTSLGVRAGGSGIPAVKAEDPIICDAVVQRMWTALPHLEEFCGSFHPLSRRAFPGAETEGQIGAVALPPGGWQLRKLEIDFTITHEATYAAVVNAFPHLRKLCIQSAGCPCPTETVARLVGTMQSLEMLKLMIPGDALPLIADYVARTRTLRHLDLEFHDPYRCGEGFDVPAWDALRALCKRRHVLLFLGRRAAKYMDA